MKYPIQYKGETLYLCAGDVPAWNNQFIPYNPQRYISEGIKLFTGIKWHHSGLLTVCNGELMVNEERGVGAITRKAIWFLERPKSQLLILRPKAAVDELQFTSHANNYLGRKYDHLNLFVVNLVYRVTQSFCKVWKRWTGKVLQPVWCGSVGTNASKVMVCAEYSATVHNRPKAYLYSVRELIEDPYFEVVYDESIGYNNTR